MSGPDPRNIAAEYKAANEARQAGPDPEHKKPSVISVPLHKVTAFGHGPTVLRPPQGVRVGGVQKPELGPREPFTNPGDNGKGLVDKSNDKGSGNASN